MEKNLKKKQWSADLALQDGWKKKQSQIQDSSSVVGVGLVFTPYRHYMVVHSCETWVELFVQAGTTVCGKASTWS